MCNKINRTMTIKNTIILLLLLLITGHETANAQYRDVVKISYKDRERELNTFNAYGWVTKDWVRYTLADGNATAYRDGFPDTRHNAHAYIEDTVIYKGKRYIVTEIEENSWYDATHLLSVRIPSTVTEIPFQAFRNCYKITKIQLPESILKIDSWAFSKCGIDSIYFPENISVIGKHAFFGCSRLKYISIPANIKRIGEGAFTECREIKRIDIHALVPPVIDKDMFRSIDVYDDRFPKSHFAVLFVPKGTVEAYRSAIGWSRFPFIEEF